MSLHHSLEEQKKVMRIMKLLPDCLRDPMRIV